MTPRMSFAVMCLLALPLACGSDDGDDGSTSTTSTEPQSCADCAADEVCETCNAVHIQTVSCVPEAVETDTEFPCGGTDLCRKDSEVCTIQPPAGDGCTRIECGALPSGCEATPTCDCVTMNETYASASCTELDGGYLVLTLPSGF